MIQRLNSYNLLTNKMTEKVSSTTYRPDEKSYKNTEKLETNFP